jgi:hypothetical protein
MNTFTVAPNTYLTDNIDGFYHTDYCGWNRPGNPNYINRLKNDCHHHGAVALGKDVDLVNSILLNALPGVLDFSSLEKATVCLMPRAKQLSKYTSDQLLFSKAVSNAVDSIKGLKNGTDWIIRKKTTRTTHLQYSTYGDSEGRLPYTGITNDTCKINPKVKGRDIILVDDVYTKYVNINEDAIQALLEAEARSVTLYVIAKTKRH